MSVRAAELRLTTVFLYHNLVQKQADVPVTPPCHLGTAVLKPHPANLGTCNHKTQTQTLTVTTAEMHQAYLWQQKRVSSNQIASLLTTSPCVSLRPDLHLPSAWLSCFSLKRVKFIRNCQTCDFSVKQEMFDLLNSILLFFSVLPPCLPAVNR